MEIFCTFSHSGAAQCFGKRFLTRIFTPPTPTGRSLDAWKLPLVGPRAIYHITLKNGVRKLYARIPVLYEVDCPSIPLHLI